MNHELPRYFTLSVNTYSMIHVYKFSNILFGFREQKEKKEKTRDKVHTKNALWLLLCESGLNVSKVALLQNERVSEKGEERERKRQNAASIRIMKM